MGADVEFSRPVRVDQLSARINRLNVVADGAERIRLAARFDLVELRSLEADVELRPLGRSGRVRVKGGLTAEVVQTCVVTLAPLEATVTEVLDLTFGPCEAAEDETGEVDLSWDRDDPPDPIIDGVIDIGEAVAEHLALALNPFPRAPDAEFEPPAEREDAPDERVGPFAGLATLRRKNE